jgi:hypothetical protein
MPEIRITEDDDIGIAIALFEALYGDATVREFLKERGLTPESDPDDDELLRTINSQGQRIVQLESQLHENNHHRNEMLAEVQRLKKLAQGRQGVIDANELELSGLRKNYELRGKTIRNYQERQGRLHKRIAELEQTIEEIRPRRLAPGVYESAYNSAAHDVVKFRDRILRVLDGLPPAAIISVDELYNRMIEDGTCPKYSKEFVQTLLNNGEAANYGKPTTFGTLEAFKIYERYEKSTQI